MYELTTQGAVQERVGVPSAMATTKMITHLDPGALTWIAVATVMVATLVHDDDIDIVIGRGDPLGGAVGDTMAPRLLCTWLDTPERLAPGSGFGSIFLVPSLDEMLRVIDGEGGTGRAMHLLANETMSQTSPRRIASRREPGRTAGAAARQFRIYDAHV
ncbi:hypothetical protein [Sphingobium sp. HWE2-09]|uniref:hypothetical protein n=1 Tax=Sphingobium sp. HWE2-09 TaxID=3108390 RepID=UPI002DCE2345|nr:hypothetical protein [Sphingobium sp. HWE2-09]